MLQSDSKVRTMFRLRNCDLATDIGTPSYIINVSSSADIIEVLLTALESIHHFKDQTVVIGLAGGSFQDPQRRRNLLQDVYFLASIGARPVVVHGGAMATEKYLVGDSHDPQKDIATDQNQMLAEEYESVGGRAMTLNFESGCVLFGERNQDHAAGHLESIDRIVIDNLCYAGQTPFIPAMCEGQGGEKMVIDEVLAIPFVAAELAAKSAIVVSDENAADRHDGMSESIGRAIASGVEKIHLVSSTIDHGILLQLFSRQTPGIEYGKAG